MEKARVKVQYDAETDILYLLFKRGPSHQLVEAGPDVVLELDKLGEVMGMEIWNAKKNKVVEQIKKAVEVKA